VTISLKEMYLGTTRKMNINRNIYCDDCRGTGALGGKLTKCKKCKG
jgi:DnaJ-class molecular chaperone